MPSVDLTKGNREIDKRVYSVLPEDVRKKFQEFLDSIQEIHFLTPDGKPNKEWRIFYGRTLDRARYKAKIEALAMEKVEEHIKIDKILWERAEPVIVKAREEVFKELGPFAIFAPFRIRRAGDEEVDKIVEEMSNEIVEQATKDARRDSREITLDVMWDMAWKQEAAMEKREERLDAAQKEKWKKVSERMLRTLREIVREKEWEAAQEEEWWNAVRNTAREVVVEAAWNAAREEALEAAWNAARDAKCWNAARDAARDAAMMASLIIVEDLLSSKDKKYLENAEERWRIWQKGYGEVGEVDGVPYVYAKHRILSALLRR